jgi:hypothetical protein
MQFDQLKRRQFITLLGAASAWPLAARAQQHKGPVRLGFFPFGSPAKAYDKSLVEAFQHGLHPVGLMENRDVVLDIVWQGDTRIEPEPVNEPLLTDKRDMSPHQSQFPGGRGTAGVNFSLSCPMGRAEVP